MICRDFPLLYSAQLDGYAAEHDQIAIQRHLRECGACRRSAAEMRGLRADLRALASPQPSPDLYGQIQKQLRQAALDRIEPTGANSRIRRAWAGKVASAGIGWLAVRRFWFNSFANWLDGRRAKIFSQSIGAVVSLLLFSVVVTEVFKQAHHTLSLAAVATQTFFQNPNDESLSYQAQIQYIKNEDALRYQAQLKAALIYPPPPPALNANDEFRGAIASLREEDVILTAEVRKDGSATILYSVPPNDPSVQAKLSTAMAQRGMFQGVGLNRSTSSDAVVYLSSITISARL
jgi:hypothetical protein